MVAFVKDGVTTKHDIVERTPPEWRLRAMSPSLWPDGKPRGYDERSR